MKKYLLLAIISITVYSSNAQWVTNGPSGQEIISLLVNGSNIYAGAYGYGLYVSANGGTSWSPVTGPTQFGTVGALAASGSTLYLGTVGTGAYKSANGTTWTPVSGISNSATVYSLAVSGSLIVAGTDGGTVISADGGSTWNTKKTGLTENIGTFCVIFKGDTVYAGTDEGLYYTTDTGAQWNSANLSGSISTIAIKDTNIFVGILDGGARVSGNGGTSWTVINNGLPSEEVVGQFLVLGDSVIMAGGGGLYLTTNNGANWDTISTGQRAIEAGSYCIIQVGSTLYVGTVDGVYQNGAGSVQGINEISDAQTDFKLYPNPSSNNFIIETTGSSWQQIQVSDITGQLLVSQPVSDAKTYINASGLAPGIYLVSLKGASAVATQKLVVAR